MGTFRADPWAHILVNVFGGALRALNSLLLFSLVGREHTLGHCRNDRKCKLPAVCDCDGIAQTVSVTMIYDLKLSWRTSIRVGQGL